MVIPRRSQSATLLNNGKVLVAGGTDNLGNVFAEAELFDPVGGTFSLTGNMQSARYLYEATLLNDGRVLVTGGLVDVNGNVLATAEAELFDPASGSFAPMGSMTIRRYLHTATLLSDGKVLVAGGVDDTTGSNPSAGAELFDPTSSNFTPTGSMGTPRSSHTATLLTDGTVLVTGVGPLPSRRQRCTSSESKSLLTASVRGLLTMDVRLAANDDLQRRRRIVSAIPPFERREELTSPFAPLALVNLIFRSCRA
jgi:hypothetical protein